MFLVPLKSLKPNYYEPVEESEAIKCYYSDKCFELCVNNSTCVQYVFFKDQKECYLKNRFYIEKGISSNAEVRSIKSND